MKQTLDTFYKSKEWVSLVGAIRLQRVNAQGDLICEYCGEPIVRAYDCIGHHVIELNDNNVNDASIVNNYNLVQNNTSPKALSALDTYRARRQQVSMVKAMTQPV